MKSKIQNPKSKTNSKFKIQNSNPEIRYLSDMRIVLYDKKWLKKAKNFPVYYMYRGLKKKGELRYDITIVPPRMLGKEFVKTKGHYHLGKHRELYKVLRGQGIFLLQKIKNSKIEDVYVVKARKNETIIIPPYYGHITINPSKKTLKIANWISKDCQNDYKLFEKRRGGCYYYTKKGWIKNKNYKAVPKLYFKKPLKSLLTFNQIKLLVGRAKIR